MQSFIWFLTFLFALAIPVAAHADTITTFLLTSSDNDFSGTLNIDTTTGKIINSYFYGRGILFQGAPTFQEKDPRGLDIYIAHFDRYPDLTDITGSYAALALPVMSLIAYGGSEICSLSFACGGGSYPDNFASYVRQKDGYDREDHGTESGLLTPVAEPSTFILLGTGIIGLIGTAHRKLLRA